MQASEQRPLPPLSIPDVHAAIREAGGVVHSDGNIFFTNAERFIVAAVLCGERVAQRDSEAREIIKESSEMVEYEILCEGDFAASACGYPRQAAREILHYAAQYAQDGKVTIHEVTRTPVDAAALRAYLENTKP